MCRVHVYKQGTFGWRLDPTIKAYKAYDVWDVPPECDSFAVEKLEEEAAVAELTHLGLLQFSVLG